MVLSGLTVIVQASVPPKETWTTAPSIGTEICTLSPVFGSQLVGSGLVLLSGVHPLRPAVPSALSTPLICHLLWTLLVTVWSEPPALSVQLVPPASENTGFDALIALRPAAGGLPLAFDTVQVVVRPPTVKIRLVVLLKVTAVVPL